MAQRFSRLLLLWCLFSVLVGCAVYATIHLNDIYGEPTVRNRVIEYHGDDPEYYRDIKPIIDQRCVVCHGCYDAPCQLKMSAFEGIDRGASKHKVYDGSRLLTARLTRLFVDAETSSEWRAKDFYPILNEREQSPEANLVGSSFYRMLALKKDHPLPPGPILPSSFDFSINRKQQCAKIEEFDRFEKDYPLWGMPYGLPAITEEKFAAITRWLANGAVVAARPPLAPAYQQQIAQWEAFFNGQSPKEKLVARYMYEHLFIANLYFPTLSDTRFFNLVRSKTPSSEPIEIIHTRRPFDDPGVDTFYYRIQPVKTTITAKRHMPYRLDAKRMARWQSLFFTPDYKINTLPSYEPAIASNPFIAFEQLPVAARYKFMLDEAEYTISGFIKGPVCRGQIALNVINDRFWVLFVQPDDKALHRVEQFLHKEKNLFHMPAEKDSVGIPLSRWLKYSKLHGQFLSAKAAALNKSYPSNEDLTLDLIWDGDGHNANAALTIFRHFDSATVTKGLIGGIPKTAWVIDYTLLERIHYLLVAGYDVYGNVGHQLLTRLYMDFLRMEGESNFLSLLPSEYAESALEHWYRGAESDVKVYLDFIRRREDGTTGIHYKTNQPKVEFFNLVEERMGNQVLAKDPINRPVSPFRNDSFLYSVQRLANLKGGVLSLLPEFTLMRVNMGDGSYHVYSLLRNLSHSNVSSLFSETKRLIPQEQSLTVVEGVLGTYPNLFLDVDALSFDRFVDKLADVKGEDDYKVLLDAFAVRRNDPNFWDYSDWIHRYYRLSEPSRSGLLDYNRLENR